MDDQLIGRAREQAQLRAFVAEALAGRGSLVLLAGEAGVGKTSLARRVLDGSGLEVLEGFGVQGGTSATLLERTLGTAAPSLRRAVFDRTDGVPFL